MISREETSVVDRARLPEHLMSSTARAQVSNAFGSARAVLLASPYVHLALSGGYPATKGAWLETKGCCACRLFGESTPCMHAFLVPLLGSCISNHCCRGASPADPPRA